jgi:hypothetical protein
MSLEGCRVWGKAFYARPLLKIYRCTTNKYTTEKEKRNKAGNFKFTTTGAKLYITIKLIGYASIYSTLHFYFLGA